MDKGRGGAPNRWWSRRRLRLFGRQRRDPSVMEVGLSWCGLRWLWCVRCRPVCLKRLWAGGSWLWILHSYIAFIAGSNHAMLGRGEARRKQAPGGELMWVGSCPRGSRRWLSRLA